MVEIEAISQNVPALVAQNARESGSAHLHTAAAHEEQPVRLPATAKRPFAETATHREMDAGDLRDTKKSRRILSDWVHILLIAVHQFHVVALGDPIERRQRLQKRDGTAPAWETAMEGRTTALLVRGPTAGTRRSGWIRGPVPSPAHATT